MTDTVTHWIDGRVPIEIKVADVEIAKAYLDAAGGVRTNAVKALFEDDARAHPLGYWLSACFVAEKAA